MIYFGINSTRHLHVTSLTVKSSRGHPVAGLVQTESRHLHIVVVGIVNGPDPLTCLQLPDLTNRVYKWAL